MFIVRYFLFFGRVRLIVSAGCSRRFWRCEQSTSHDVFAMLVLQRNKGSSERLSGETEKKT